MEVACDSVSFFRKGTFIPVIGDAHDDREIINFPQEHWHIDWRFVCPSTVRDMLEGRKYRWKGDHISRSAPAGALMAQPISVCNTTGMVAIRMRKCFRLHPTFPIERAGWGKPLEDKYAAANEKCGICPHRGMPLDGAPVRDGARICPGHGLGWSVATGELVRRA